MENQSDFSLKQIVQQIPGVRALYSRVVQKYTGNRGLFRLQNILKTSSLYHKDFMPVYQVITSSEKALESELFG